MPHLIRQLLLEGENQFSNISLFSQIQKSLETLEVIKRICENL